ncbi:hypothetical protein G6F68_012061 [Rhizopus microsporus]|nr:hypothetical protein G6F68_012061 [Rhizopus microsporus]
MFVTSVTGDVQHALSIPAGELSLAHHRIKWDIGTLDSQDEATIKAQFETKNQGTPQPIAVRFDINNVLSQLEINQGNDINVLWVNIREVKKHSKAGKYIIG